MIFYYHANKTHFHKKGFALGFILRVRVFGTRKWPISLRVLITTNRSNIKQLNHIIFTFSWKGKDKVTRLSAINTLEEGGIKMRDIKSMHIKALRLAWLKRIFNNNDSTWKVYLIHLLKQLGDLLIFECNYAIKDLPTNLYFL